MDLQLQNDTAIVFGAASGIGLAIARAFVAEGARVVLADRSPTVQDAARELQATGVVLDVTDEAAVRAFAAQTPGQHIVYAVGTGSGKFGFPYWNLGPADWPRIFEANLFGAVNVAHAYGPALAEARQGTMLFLASVAGQMGSQTDPPYSAAKAALINFAQCAAKDLAAFQVRVNVLSPGMVQTPLNRSVWQAWADRQTSDTWQSYEQWAGEKIRKVIPLSRWQTPEEMAAMAVFLASPHAQNITGQTLNIDGGFVMHS